MQRHFSRKNRDLKHYGNKSEKTTIFRIHFGLFPKMDIFKMSFSEKFWHFFFQKIQL
jgi:hypothetical protein